MSLGVVVKGTEGIVLAADSRVTLNAKRGDAPGFLLHFDNATKLLTFSEPNLCVGAVTWGDAVIGTKPNDLRTAHSYVPEYEARLPKTRLSIEDFAKKLSDFYMEQWQSKMPQDYKGSGMIFVVGGFDEDAPYSRMFELNIPKQPIPQEKSPNNFGIAWGGQPEYAARLIHGYDEGLLKLIKQKLELSDKQITEVVEALQPLNMGIPYAVLSLQDCIDLAIFLVKTTIEAQSLSITLRGVGGAIDVAVITRRDGLQIIQQKQLVGERTTQEGGEYHERKRHNR
ncbi:MAG: hypothetical protein O8C64_00610 [Candidatus Methanoperedens sp.]|nr:hypothetical protein [Candidatus Methanoperedens sp.]